MAKLPLGGTNSDYDSKKSRGYLLNMIAEGDKKSFRTVKRCDGLTLFGTALGPIRSNILVNGGYAYFISGANLYRANTLGVMTSLGVINGSEKGQIVANAVPGNNQILVLNGSGSGYIYDNSGLTQITDADFYSTTSVTILNERFWFVRDGTNEFFASDVSDGTAYNPLSFASAEESPDDCIAIVAKKSSLFVLNSTTIEFWQSFNDPLLPVRKVRSATIERGIIAKGSLAEIGESFIFLADDLTVIMITENSKEVISDLDFTLKIRGNGTTIMPGFSTVSDAVGFTVDSPTHKLYYLTFPSQGMTWGFDLTTGFSHFRKSEDFDYWRVAYSALFNNKIIMGDLLNGSMWTLDPDAKKEGGEILRAEIVTQSISFPHDITIPLIELDMEVGQIEDPSVSPVIMVAYTKDGGYNWINHSNIELGVQGNYSKRVPLRQFGRLVRHKEFALKLTVTDPVRVQFYGAEMPVGQFI